MKPIKDEEYIYRGSWCIVEDYDEINVYLYFGNMSSVYSLDDFMKNVKLY